MEVFATDFFEAKVLNAFNNITAAGAGGLYVALFLSNPSETGAAGTEAEYADYARQPVTFGEPYTVDGGVAVRNENDLLWGKTAGDIGQVRYIGVCDSAVRGAGNMWLYGELSVPLDIRANQQPTIFAGDILFISSGNFSLAFKSKTLNLLRGRNLAGFVPHLALFDGDPEAGGGELTGGGYARPAVAFNAPSEQAGGQMMITSTAEVRFPAPTTPWGLWAWDGVKDAAVSGELVLKKINPTPETLLKNYVAVVPAGDYKVAVN